MHVAVDARELVGRPTGVGRYLSCLLEHWAGSAQARAHRFTLFAHHAIPSLPPSLEVSQVLLPGSGGTRWEQGTLAVALRRATPDVRPVVSSSVWNGMRRITGFAMVR